MLDALKGIGGGNKTDREELQKLVDRAREERSALSTMLTQVAMRSAKLGEHGKVLEQTDKKVIHADGRLDELLKRVDGFESKTKTFDAVEARIEAMLESARNAQAAAEKLMAPDGDFQKHRQLVQQLSSQALDTKASVEALARERAVLEELRQQITQSKAESKQAVEQAAALRAELAQVRGAAGQLNQDYGKLREATRAASEEAAGITASVKDVESKLGPLMQLEERAKTTEDKLASLNALAEHVSHKTKALEGHRLTLDRATAEANRLNEMIWAMDQQIGKLNEGLKESTKAEEAVARIDTLVEEASAKADAAGKARDDIEREHARFEKDGRALVDQMRAALDRVGQERKTLEVYERRLGVLQSGVGEAEGRLEALGARERHLAQLGQQVEALTKEFDTLRAGAEEMTGKQAALDTLGERLAEVEEMARRTSTQFEGLKQTRNDLERLRLDIEDFHKAHAEAAQLRDALGADRSALETFVTRVGEFKARTPEIEARLDTVLGKLERVEEGTKQAAKLDEIVAQLDAQATRVGSRVQFLDKLEGRVDGLHDLSVEIDGKLTEQLDRRTELDALKTQVDGLVAQMLDAHQKVAGVAALQSKVLPMENSLTILQDRLEKAQGRLQAVQRDDAALDEQETRLGTLVESGKALAADSEARLKQVQALNEQLAAASTAKDELVGELARIQSRQRDVMSQSETAEDQLKRADTMLASLEQRRSQLAFTEKRVGAVEARLGELSGKQKDVDEKIAALGEREKVVDAVRAQVEGVHAVSAQSKADLDYVTGHREEVATLRGEVEKLLGMARDTEQKIASIESRRAMVNDVQAKSNQISNLLEDVRVNLEMVGEQKAVIDHVGERLARLEFVMREAQSTLQTLQHERELAERIEKNIQALRGQAVAKTAEGGGSKSA